MCPHQDESSPFFHAMAHWMHGVMSYSMGSFVQFAKANNLSLSQIGTLFHIQKAGICGVHQISHELGVSNPAASQMLDRLVEQGLINRKEDPQDRRAKQLELTEAGQDLIRRVVRVRQDWISRIEDQLSDHQKDKIVSAVTLLSRTLGNLADQADRRGL